MFLPFIVSINPSLRVKQHKRDLSKQSPKDLIDLQHGKKPFWKANSSYN
jgi:hypothetical protein